METTVSAINCKINLYYTFNIFSFLLGLYKDINRDVPVSTQTAPEVNHATCHQLKQIYCVCVCVLLWLATSLNIKTPTNVVLGMV